MAALSLKDIFLILGEFLCPLEIRIFLTIFGRIFLDRWQFVSLERCSLGEFVWTGDGCCVSLQVHYNGPKHINAWRELVFHAIYLWGGIPWPGHVYLFLVTVYSISFKP